MGNFVRALLVTLICALCAWRSALLGLGTAPSAEVQFKASRLDEALAMNPRYSAAWIARGLEAEKTGDRRTAEESLLRAAAVDLGYLPAWTLANFYLRAGDDPQFWEWARSAANMAYDPAALFQLCWRVSNNSSEILHRAIPPRQRRAYLDFLTASGRLDAAEPVARDLRRSPTPADVDPLLRYCDAALAQNRAQPALDTWTALAGVPNLPAGHCFGWRKPNVPGAEVSIGAHEIQVSLSGRQPESCDLLEQYVVVQPDTRHRVRVEGITRDLPVPSGLEWKLLDTGAGDLARLILRYRRPTGAMRAEGQITFSLPTVERAE